MALRIVEIHPSGSPEELNQEWFVLENQGDKPFSTKNCVLGISRRGQKKRIELGTMDPGVVLAPGDKVRVVTGNPGRKAHGALPDGEPKNYNLFLGSAVLRGPGTVLTVALRSLALASAEFDPAQKSGVAVDA